MTLPSLPLLDGGDADEVFTSFAAWAEAQGTVLYPAQEEALIELVSGANVVLATPTGPSRPWSARSSSPCARCSVPQESAC